MERDSHAEWLSRDHLSASHSKTLSPFLFFFFPISFSFLCIQIEILKCISTSQKESYLTWPCDTSFRNGGWDCKNNKAYDFLSFLSKTHEKQRTSVRSELCEICVFLSRCCWWLMSMSVLMLMHVEWWTGIVQETLLGLVDTEDEGIIILQNVGRVALFQSTRPNVSG